MTSHDAVAIKAASINSRRWFILKNTEDLSRFKSTAANGHAHLAWKYIPTDPNLSVERVDALDSASINILIFWRGENVLFLFGKLSTLYIYPL